jgi:hypothetical protein
MIDVADCANIDVGLGPSVDVIAQVPPQQIVY